jgi:uncharacterized protein YqgC (DUF456 family)
MPALSPEVLYWISALLVVVGFLGTFLPVLPGVPLVFAGMALAAYADGFVKVSAVTVLILGLITIFAVLIDFLAASVGAKRLGASRQAIVGALLGTLVGLFFGIPGLLLGPLIGAALGEFLATRDAPQAARAGAAAWLGFFVGTLLKLVLTFAMGGIFIAAWLID